MLTKLSDLNKSSGIQLISEKTYLQAGNYTFNVPLGVSKIYVAVFGAGGCGAGANTSTGAYGFTGGGGGGFSGGYLEVKAGDSYNVTVGAGGSLGFANTNTNGVNGGTSSFGTHLTATGGKGGKVGTVVNTPIEGGAGGSGFVSTEVLGAITSNGGRGGNHTVGNNSESASSVRLTGGGASGSPFGDGGRGGDILVDMGSYNTIYTGGGGWNNGEGGDVRTSGNDQYTGGGGFLGKGGSTTGVSSLGSGGGAFSDGSVSTSTNFVGEGGTGLGTEVFYFKGFISILDGSLLTGNGASSGNASPYVAATAGGGGGAGLNNAAEIVRNGGIAGGGGAYGKSIFGGGSGSVRKTPSALIKNGNGGGSGAAYRSTSSAPINGGDGAVIILW